MDAPSRGNSTIVIQLSEDTGISNVWSVIFVAMHINRFSPPVTAVQMQNPASVCPVSSLGHSALAD